MACICVEILIGAPPERVWAAVRDIGAVLWRLVPGHVAATRLEGDNRFLTFPDGGWYAS